jgi:hypothetical protein
MTVVCVCVCVCGNDCRTMMQATPLRPRHRPAVAERASWCVGDVSMARHIHANIHTMRARGIRSGREPEWKSVGGTDGAGV